MHFGWTEEETMWRRSVREFAQKKIAPRVREIDSNNRIPDDIVKGMTDMGLWAPTVSEAYGGQGMNVTMATIAAEELGRAEISLALPVWYLVEASWGFIFDRYASPALKQEILPGVTAGKKFLGIATTEPGGGSDIEGVTRSRGERQPDGNWILNGEKVYISGIKESQRIGGIHMTLVRTDPSAGHKGFTFFAVPLKDNPHVTPTYFENWGRTGISTGGFTMENMPLDDRYRIGEVGQGFYMAMEGFTFARALIGATCVGAADTALNMGVDVHQAAQIVRQAAGRVPGGQLPGRRALRGHRDRPPADLQGRVDGRRDVRKGRVQAPGHRAVRRHGQAARADHGVRDLQRGRQLAGRDGLYQGISHRNGHPRRPLLLHRRRGRDEYHADDHRAGADRGGVYESEAVSVRRDA